MFVIGMGTGAFQSGLNSYLNQKNSGFAVDWGTVGKETLKGGVISGIAGGMGGALANSMTPLKFCGKGAMEIAGDVVEHWAVGTMGDAATTMVTTYVSDRMDGKSPQEAFQNVMSSADDILVDSMWTSAAGTLVDSVTAPKCFVAGTMITTISGLKAIENISIGDKVLAQNPETGEIAYKEVLDTFRNETNVVVHITVNDETFTSTEEHPFYVEGKGWINASALHAGMVVWLADGTKAIIQDVWTEYLAEAVAVYNFKVEDFHTYFVGYSGILVHNAYCGETTVNQKGQTIEQDSNGRWRDTETGQFAEGPDGPSNNGSLRQQYMGSTPGKNSTVGQAVKEAMGENYRIIDGDEYFFDSRTNQWYDISMADMSHKTDAVTWWNETGRYYGAQSPEVREFMTNPDNYTLELFSSNRSRGAIVGQTQQYLPPLK